MTQLPVDKFGLAAVQEQGERDHQEDRFLLVERDGSWLMAVADDVSSFMDEPGTASDAAISALPERIGSDEEMVKAFEMAHTAVCEASDRIAERRGTPINQMTAEITTLAIAAYTPEGGLLIGWAGDTMLFLVPCDGEVPGWHGRPSHESLPTRNHPDDMSLRSNLSYWPGGYRAEVDLVSDPFGKLVRTLSQEIPREEVERMTCDHGLLVVLASDGLYSPVFRAHEHCDPAHYPDDNSIGFALPPGARYCPEAALAHLMSTARKAGLHDNATATAAVFCP